MWESLISWLVWLSVDPVTVDQEYPKAAAAVAAARASMATEPAANDCPNGKCAPGVAPAPVSPARPHGGR